MNVRRRVVISLLGAWTLVAVGCARDLGSGSGQSTGNGGAGGDAGTGDRVTATDARLKADSQCQYDVDAVHVSTENPGDACLFAVPAPDPTLPVDRFRIVVDGVELAPDSINGWGFTDATQRVVRIAGPACDAIKAGTVQTVWVEWYCYGIA